MRQHLLLTLFLGICAFNLNAQISIKGQVTDADNNSPMIGVTILEKNTTNGTISDIDGNYTIQVSDENAILVFSYIGYSSQEQAVSTQTQINLSLSYDVSSLDEVVVVGYGTQKKSVVTGAISKITNEDLEDMPLLRLENTLQGRTSGVRVVSGSGQPGEGATVRIRGTGTIGNADPLYVVDGVPIGGGIDYLNQNDIASIEVLKDAASASIYGARAANGVVLVTTKKGSDNGLKVNYNSYYGVQDPTKKLALLNATEYATLMNESSVASGGSVLFEDPQSLGEGTDWQNAVFNDRAPIQEHQLSISAGNEISKYYVSFGYFDQYGIVSEDDSRYRRFTTRFNSDHNISNRIKFGSTVAYTRTRSNGVSTNSEYGSPLSRALNLDPLTPILETDSTVLAGNIYSNNPVVTNEDGVPYGISSLVTSEVLNPLAALEVQQGYGWSDKVVSNAFVSYEPIEGLTFRSSIGLDLAFWGGEGFTPVHYLNAANRVDVNSYNRSQNRGLFWNWENTLAYSKRINNHSLQAVVGTTAQKNNGEGIGGTIQDIPVTNIDDASLSYATTPESQVFYGFEYFGTLASYFGRVNYNYAEKYLLTATWRVDGSSNFGRNYKFGNFPSVSLGWVVTEENFLSRNPIVNFLKMRASYGVTGNDQIGAFLYASTVGGGRNYTFGTDDNLVNGTSPNAIANPDLRWEETTQTNFGIDAKIFKRVSLTFDWFDKTTNGMLLGIAVPGYVGNGGPIGNIASMRNTGYELELGYAKSFGNFELDISGNASYVKNEVIDLGNDKDFLTGQTFSPQGLEITRTSVGLPIGYFYGYQTDGIFQNQEAIDAYVNADGALVQPNASPGDFKFVDLNDNGEIDPDDRGVIGDPTPNWTYGFNIKLAYKAFDLVIFGQGVAGNDVFKATRRFDLQMANMTADALDRWTGEGTSTTYPRLVMNDPNQNFSRSSDFYIEDGSFLRLKNVQLGFNLPRTAASKIGIDRLRIYVSGNNLLTFTKYSGYDPEIGGGSYGVDRGFYPQPRTFMVGLNGTF